MNANSIPLAWRMDRRMIDPETIPRRDPNVKLDPLETTHESVDQWSYQLERAMNMLQQSESHRDQLLSENTMLKESLQSWRQQATNLMNEHQQQESEIGREIENLRVQAIEKDKIIASLQRSEGDLKAELKRLYSNMESESKKWTEEIEEKDSLSLALLHEQKNSAELERSLREAETERQSHAIELLNVRSELKATREELSVAQNDCKVIANMFKNLMQQRQENDKVSDIFIEDNMDKNSTLS